jgi:hypothetical protein
MSARSDQVRKKQYRFSKMVALLILFVYERGYTMSFGDAWAHDGHMPNSLHYDRLAIDINLFKNGVYLEETKDYREPGEFWESIGGSWGGRFSSGDGNHFSLSFEGRR